MAEQNDLRKLTRKTLTLSDEAKLGRKPPQALELEEAVLGAMLLEKDAPVRVLDVLMEGVFYHDAHQVIFRAIKRLFDQGEPVDLLTVTENLRQAAELQAAGGAYYVTQLTNKVASSANIEFHAKILLQKYIQREMIRISGEINRDAFEDTTDAFSLLDDAEKKLFAIKNDTIKKNYDSIDDLIHKAIKQIESLKDQTGGLTGIPSGFTNIDRITNGWQRSDLVILAGRPGMGKTAFVLGIARNAAVDHKKPVAVFSLEMSSLQLVTRLISGETELEAEKFRSGKLADYEWEQLNARVQTLSDAPIYIDDTPQLSIFDLRAKARRLKSNKGIEMIIIDYLQLMRGDDGGKSGNREQEISYISRSLKSLAKELDIPVIALAQLSRAVESRPDKIPILSDLRESGSIEQDADLVGFLYRPEYYDITVDAEGNDLTGIGEFIIAKHRHGKTGKARIAFKSKFAKFEDLQYHEDGDFGGEPDSSITFGSKLNDMNLPPMDDEDLMF
ncbi:MAG: replicative DNA helicase [Flavobacteriales bacterium]|nr:replicative DNA helicase [Bacteroidota bacterium]MCB9239893.1 replicative DNA helicase [Flavobacteriales bacterium]